MSRLGREVRSHATGWNIQSATLQLRDAVRHADLGMFNQSIRAGCMFNKPDHRKLDNPLHEAAKLRPSQRSSAIQHQLIVGTDLHGNRASFDQMNLKGLRPFDVAVQYANEQFLWHMLNAMTSDPTGHYGTGDSRDILAIRDTTPNPRIRQILEAMAEVQWKVEEQRSQRMQHGRRPVASGQPPLRTEVVNYAQVTQVVERMETHRVTVRNDPPAISPNHVSKESVVPLREVLPASHPLLARRPLSGR